MFPNIFILIIYCNFQSSLASLAFSEKYFSGIIVSVCRERNAGNWRRKPDGMIGGYAKFSL